ncbi:DinB family protein [Pseudoduganella ginsengisoli]|uniref:Damage-inducible protein DinB n=1 Tax=Pseudoduganella ginsengisoli TaxID=1462440 RepID=A0A6L6Q2R6_9BURK|nr:DinB family protein [Pseudoduganella ginsengisoli]MTW03709.1 damage-inducible protein DinB [Pseudoduganella ginsengisoli]
MFNDIFKYKQWADRRTLDAVAAIDQDQFPGAMAFARQQLNHMVRVEELFKARLTGQPDPHASTNTEQLPQLSELDQRITASNLWFGRFIGATPLLNEPVTFQFVDGKQGSMTRQEILFHIVNHGTYHRGAIGHALDLAKGARPADTFTVYLHAAEPGRRERTELDRG